MFTKLIFTLFEKLFKVCREFFQKTEYSNSNLILEIWKITWGLIDGQSINNTVLLIEANLLEA